MPQERDLAYSQDPWAIRLGGLLADVCQKLSSLLAFGTDQLEIQGNKNLRRQNGTVDVSYESPWQDGGSCVVLDGRLVHGSSCLLFGGRGYQTGLRIQESGLLDSPFHQN